MKRRLLKKQSSIKRFTVDIPNSAQIYVKEKDIINKGDILYSVQGNKVIEQLDLANALKIKPNRCKEIVQVVDGQFVDDQTVIASEKGADQMSVRVIYPDKSGVANLDLIDEGIVQIVDYTDDTVVNANFEGQVIDVKNGIRIMINAKTVDFEVVAKKTPLKKSIIGDLLVLGNGEGIYTERDIRSLDVKDKIVYVGKYLYANLLVALNQRGVLAIITHSMDYNDYIKHEGNIVVLSGFGHVPLNKENFVIDRKIDECTVNISSKGNTISFIGADECFDEIDLVPLSFVD